MKQYIFFKYKQMKDICTISSEEKNIANIYQIFFDFAKQFYWQFEINIASKMMPNHNILRRHF